MIMTASVGSCRANPEATYAALRTVTLVRSCRKVLDRADALTPGTRMSGTHALGQPASWPATRILLRIFSHPVSAEPGGSRLRRRR